MIRRSSPTGSLPARDLHSPSSSSTCTLHTASSTLSFCSTPSRSPSPSVFPSSPVGYESYPSYHPTSIISTSTTANINDLVHIGPVPHSAVSPAGSSGSYQGTNAISSHEGSASGCASGVSSGMMGSDSSLVSEISQTRSQGYRAQRPAEDETSGNLPFLGGSLRRVPGQEEEMREHTLGRSVSHAHSTSLSTVTGSPSHPREGLSDVPMGSVFPGSGFGSGLSHQAQTSYSVQPLQPQYGFPQHVQSQAPVLAPTRSPSQQQYQYGPVSALHPASGFASHQGRAFNRAQPPPVAEPRGQARTVVPIAGIPPVRASTKRPRAPKRPRPDPSAIGIEVGIGPSRSNLEGSDTDSDDDEVEWIPGPGGGSSAGGSGVDRNAGTGGRAGLAAPGLPGGRKCVSLLSLLPTTHSFSYFFPLTKYDADADDCFHLLFLSFPSSLSSQISARCLWLSRLLCDHNGPLSDISVIIFR